MRCLILGGDGYLGWPQALYLSSRGYQVRIVDSLVRRRFDLEYNTSSLTPIEDVYNRTIRWSEITNQKIDFDIIDIVDYPALLRIFAEFKPEVIIHFGEQRSAPFSMIDRNCAVFTQMNNIVGTLNVLYCMAEETPTAHLVKLGTMGEYGTPNIDIEEGFIQINHKGRTDILPFPKQPGSFYHLSKVHDSHNIMFCCRTWGLRATDLNQGIVYGVATPETMLDSALSTRYDYDQIYGTALNRFCVEAVVGVPLTVYGSGNQTRGYININDTMRCVELAILNPPDPSEYRVFNQFTEQFSLIDISEKVSYVGQKMGHKISIERLPNPRIEMEQHYYNAVHTKLEQLGLVPTLLNDEAIATLLNTVALNINRVERRMILPTVNWRNLHNEVRVCI